jgi:hypothetical protein
MRNAPIRHALQSIAPKGTNGRRNVSSPTPIIKIYATNDGIARKEDILKNKELLLAYTRFVEIVGRNHSLLATTVFNRGTVRLPSAARTSRSKR